MTEVARIKKPRCLLLLLSFFFLFFGGAFRNGVWRGGDRKSHAYATTTWGIGTAVQCRDVPGHKETDKMAMMMMMSAYYFPRRTCVCTYQCIPLYIAQLQQRREKDIFWGCPKMMRNSNKKRGQYVSKINTFSLFSTFSTSVLLTYRYVLFLKKLPARFCLCTCG